MNGSITLDWGDKEHQFRLGIGELEELEDKRGTGTGAIFRRCMTGDWYVQDIREIIRLGLVGGGGMEAHEAIKIVERYVDKRPWSGNSFIALAILDAALNGPAIEGEAAPEKEEDEPEKQGGDDENPQLAKGEKPGVSPSPESTPIRS